MSNTPDNTHQRGAAYLAWQIVDNLSTPDTDQSAIAMNVSALPEEHWSDLVRDTLAVCKNGLGAIPQGPATGPAARFFRADMDGYLAAHRLTKAPAHVRTAELRLALSRHIQGGGYCH